MARILATLSFLFLSFSLFANILVLDPVATSSKGQFVALEEYRVIQSRSLVHVRIKVYNAWKDKFLGKPIDVYKKFDHSKPTVAAKKEAREEARKEAIILARKKFKRYNINI